MKTQIEKFYLEAQVLRQDADAVVKALSKHNPGIKSNPPSLVTIGADLGALVRHCNSLRVDIMQLYERNQRDDFTTEAI